MDPFTSLQDPLVLNLRCDPYERAGITSNTCRDWQIVRTYLVAPAQACVGEFLHTSQDFPWRQKAAGVSRRGVMPQLVAGG